MGRFELLSLIIAFIGFLITIGLAVWKYRIERSMKHKAERLSRIEEQLKHLYGPLYSLLIARKKAWEIFKSGKDLDRWVRGREFQDQRIPSEDLNSWKNWIKHESKEANKQLNDIILQNTHLIIEDSMPQEFELLFIHYSQYRYIINLWDDGKDDIFFADIPFPEDKLTYYVVSSFMKLKWTQYKLLGHRFPLVDSPRASQNTTPVDGYLNHGAE